MKVLVKENFSREKCWSFSLKKIRGTKKKKVAQIKLISYQALHFHTFSQGLQLEIRLPDYMKPLIPNKTEYRDKGEIWIWNTRIQHHRVYILTRGCGSKITIFTC